jgi:hypothetical protein
MGQVLFSVLGTLLLSDLEPKLCSRIGNILHTPLFRRHALAPEFRRRREWEQVYSAECEPRRKSDVVSSAARHPRVIVDKILMEGTSMNFGSALSKMVMRRLIDVYKLPNPFPRGLRCAALMIKLLRVRRRHQRARSSFYLCAACEKETH